MIDANMIKEIRHTGSIPPPYLFLLKHYFAVLYKHGFALQLDKNIIYFHAPKTGNYPEYLSVISFFDHGEFNCKKYFPKIFIEC